MATVKTLEELSKELINGVATTEQRNEIFTWDDNLKPDQQKVIDIYEEKVKAGFDMTLEDATKFNQFNAEFASTMLGAAGQSLAEVVLGRDDIETLESHYEVAGLDLGLFYSKPMLDNPQREDFESSFGFGVGVKLNNETLNESRLAVGNLWDAFSDDEDDSEE